MLEGHTPGFAVGGERASVSEEKTCGDVQGMFLIKQEGDMLQAILDLGDVEVSEIMTHRKNMAMIDGNEAPAAIVEQVEKSPYTRLPVWRGEPDNILGVIHAKDVLGAALSHRGDLNSLDIMAIASKPWFIPDTTSSEMVGS